MIWVWRHLKSFVHNCVMLRWVALYLAPGNWSGLFRAGVFHVPICVEAQPDRLAFSWVQDPDNQFLNVSLLLPESCHLYATLGLFFVVVAFLDSDFVLPVPSSHRPEMMSVYFWNSMKLVVWATRLACGLGKEEVQPQFRLLMNGVISESSPSFENSDVIHIHCQDCNRMTLDV